VDGAGHAWVERVDGAQDLERLFGLGQFGADERGRVGAGLTLVVARAAVPGGRHHHLIVAADIDPDTQIKDLETDTFSVTTLRTWLQNRSTAPVPAAPALENQPASQPPASAATISVQPASTPVLQIQPVPRARTITGKTTFQELIDWGLPIDTIREILGSEMPDPSMAIKDCVTSQGMEFSTLKQLLQDELDRHIP
jgi:hypothetical protein